MRTIFFAPISLFTVMANLSAGAAILAPTHTVASVAELAQVQKLMAIEDATAPALHILIATGTYTLTDSLRIARSNVSLSGEPGTRLVLADGVNEPIIAIGTQQEIAGAADVISHITISGLELDGNMDHQTSETSLVRPWIRNNGIDVRAVHDLTVSHVSADRNRSGGLVISWGCRDIQVLDSVFRENFFDGVAYYDSEKVLTARCVMTNNHAAGVSLDNDFRDSVFAECRIEANGDVGVFARWSQQIAFMDCVIQDSGNWAFFLGHDGEGRGVADVTISGCRVEGNRGGVNLASVDEAQSRRTKVIASTFGGNERDGRSHIVTSGSPIATDALVILTGGEGTEQVEQPDLVSF